MINIAEEVSSAKNSEVASSNQDAAVYNMASQDIDEQSEILLEKFKQNEAKLQEI